MDPAIRRIRITTLAAQVELCTITCAALEREFSQPGLKPEKRAEFFQRWDALIRDRKTALKKLAMLEPGKG